VTLSVNHHLDQVVQGPHHNAPPKPARTHRYQACARTEHKPLAQNVTSGVHRSTVTTPSCEHVCSVQ